MVKGILLLGCLLILSGCSGFTHTGAQKTLSEGRSARYTSYVEAKATAVTSLAQLLTTVDRGGVTVEVDADGRVKSFRTVERLDMAALVKLAQVAEYKEAPVKSTLEEIGDLVVKSTALGAVVASEVYGYKSNHDNQAAAVAMNEQDNTTDRALWSDYSNNFNNTSVTDNSDSVSVTDVRSDISNLSVTSTTDVSSTSLTDSSNNMSTLEQTAVVPEVQ